MQVLFTKGPGTSYDIAVHRGTGAVLAPRNGPGGHPYLPHDLVHLLVEQVAGIELGDKLLYVLLALLVAEQALAYSASFHPPRREVAA